jgi:hypothetical protein
MAREKAPALARSESHEVGHAEGEDEYIDPQNAAKLLTVHMADVLKKRSGV